MSRKLCSATRATLNLYAETAAISRMHTASRTPIPLALCALCVAAALPPAHRASAQTAPADQTQAAAPEKPYVAPANLSEWASSIKLGFQGEGGIVVNTQS